MKKRHNAHRMQLALLIMIFLSGCNFPTFQMATATDFTVPTPEGETQTQTPLTTNTALPSATFTSLPSDITMPTLTATRELTPTITVMPTAAPTNTLVPTPTRHLVASIRGVVWVEKNVRILPLGGAGVSLYDDQRRTLIASTKTNIEGGFQINELASGRYYLVLVWFVKSSGWPCAKSSLPDPDRKAVWEYVVHGLAHRVQIQNRGDDTFVVSIGTGAFGFDGRGTRQVEVTLKCNELN